MQDNKSEVLSVSTAVGRHRHLGEAPSHETIDNSQPPEGGATKRKKGRQTSSGVTINTDLPLAVRTYFVFLSVDICASFEQESDCVLVTDDGSVQERRLAL